MTDALRLSANISMLFTEAPFIERIALAATHGFRAVECWYPYDHAAHEVKAALDANGVSMIGINTPPGDASRGEFGFAALAERGDAFTESFERALAYSVAVHCNNIHVLSGVLDASSSASWASALFIERITHAAELAASEGKTLLLEPLNPIDRPGYFLSTQRQARDLIRAIKQPNVKVMFDAYHVQMTEGNIVARFREQLPHVGHVQIADVPGRHEPGSGEINFDFVLNAIAESDYDGWIGCEYKPLISTVEGLSWRGRYDAAKR